MAKKKHYVKKLKKYKTKMEIMGKDNDVVYIRLDKHPGKHVKGCSGETLWLWEIPEKTRPIKGPAIYLDVDKEGYIIGIEILY